MKLFIKICNDSNDNAQCKMKINTPFYEHLLGLWTANNVEYEMRFYTFVWGMTIYRKIFLKVSGFLFPICWSKKNWGIYQFMWNSLVSVRSCVCLTVEDIFEIILILWK